MYYWLKIFWIISKTLSAFGKPRHLHPHQYNDGSLEDHSETGGSLSRALGFEAICDCGQWILEEMRSFQVSGPMQFIFEMVSVGIVMEEATRSSSEALFRQWPSRPDVPSTRRGKGLFDLTADGGAVGLTGSLWWWEISLIQCRKRAFLYVLCISCDLSTTSLYLFITSNYR